MAYQAEIDGEQDEWDDEESYIEIGFESDAFRTGSSNSHSSSLRKQWLHQVSVHSRKLGGLVINPSPGTFFTGWVRFLWYRVSDHISYIICWPWFTYSHTHTHAHLHVHLPLAHFWGVIIDCRLQSTTYPMISPWFKTTLIPQNPNVCPDMSWHSHVLMVNQASAKQISCQYPWLPYKSPRLQYPIYSWVTSPFTNQLRFVWWSSK